TIYGDRFSDSRSFFGFIRASWRPVFWLWFLFRLHGRFMATVFLTLVPFSASLELHGDQFSGFGSFFGFMGDLWRPFF
ncbi:hypothetical protein, partial [Cytobacillus firmus]|uniref:hypothetical protein n=1 Tax=Cytobacillus firmus TaxID=1399 RepID=UPI00216375BA